MLYAIATARPDDAGFAIAHRGVESNGRIFQAPQWRATVATLEEGDFILLLSEEPWPSAYLYMIHATADGGNAFYGYDTFMLSRDLDASRTRLITAISQQERSRNANR